MPPQIEASTDSRSRMGTAWFVMFLLTFLILIVIFIAWWADRAKAAKAPTPAQPEAQDDIVEEPAESPDVIIEEEAVEEPKYVPKGYKREQKVCQFLESHYGKGFPTAHPEFLKNPKTGRNLELDCFNEALKIGAEVNGEQHYVFPNSFHKTETEFTEQVWRDQFKKEQCDNTGTYLVTVPYWVDYDDIEHWVRYHLPENVKARERVAQVMLKKSVI